MPISVTCRCGKRLRVKDELAGKRVKCPACGAVLPTPNSPAAKVVTLPKEPSRAASAAPEEPASNAAANYSADVAAKPPKKAQVREKRSHKVMLFVGVGAAVLLCAFGLCGFGLWYFVQPSKGPGEVDTKGLPREGPGDSALTYDVVKADPAKYRGKRVTWAFAPLSSEGKRIMCALDMNEAIGPRHAGIYVVEFASDKEVGDAFNAAAFQAGSTVTATVAGQVDQFLVVRDAKGVPQKDIPKVTVPLLVYPTYKAGEGDGIKGKGKG
jgi:hypothetical protein